MAEIKKSQPNDWKGILEQLESTIKVYLVDKAPALPENIKEIIVKFSPWITLILVVFALPAVLAVFGLSAILAPFALGAIVKNGFNYGIGLFGTILTLVVLVIEAMAIPGLFKRQMKAWKLLFYASLVSAVQSLVYFNLGGLIIGTLISWYFLFQIKSKYK